MKRSYQKFHHQNFVSSSATYVTLAGDTWKKKFSSKYRDVLRGINSFRMFDV